jgi:hypothetical protein
MRRIFGIAAPVIAAASLAISAGALTLQPADVWAQAAPNQGGRSGGNGGDDTSTTSEGGNDPNDPCFFAIAVIDCDDRRRETRQRERPDVRACFIGGEYAVCSAESGDERERLVIGEAGTIVLWQAGRGQVHTVGLQHRYLQPIAIVGPVTDAGSEPVFARVVSVEGDRFSFELEEWPGHDGITVLEEVGYLIVEAGNWVLPNSTFLRAGQVDGVNHNPQSVPIGDGFEGDPVLLTQIISDRSSDPVAARQYATDNGGFDALVQRGSGRPREVDPAEVLAWVLWEQGESDEIGAPFLAASTEVEVTHERTRIIGNETEFSPVVLAAMQTVNEPDVSIVRYRNAVAQVDVMIDEQGREPAVIAHEPERVGFVLVDPGLIEVYAKDQPGSNTN